MSYTAQAADLLALLDRLGLEQVAIVGHSMGARCMQLAKLAPTRVAKLVVADIAPVAYPHARHQNVFAGLNATLKQAPQSRSEAEAILAQHIEIAGVRQFLLKSFAKAGHGWGWRFNVPALERNYANIMGWPDAHSRFEGPALFIKGRFRLHAARAYRDGDGAIPAAKARVIAGTGHWLHAEKPVLFNKLVVDFLSTGG